MINLVGNAEQASLRKVHLGGHLKCETLPRWEVQQEGARYKTEKQKPLSKRGRASLRGAGSREAGKVGSGLVSGRENKSKDVHFTQVYTLLAELI